MSTDDLALRDEELGWLRNQGRGQWKLVNGRIAQSGAPTANVGSYTSLNAFPPTQAQTTAALTTTTPGVGLWTSTIWSPILGNAAVAGSGYHIEASGTIATTTTSQTATFLPSVGTGLVNAAPTAYQTLGVSGLATLATTALTSIWFLRGDLTIRSTGTAGTAWFMGMLHYGTTAAPTSSAAASHILLGGTVATVDFTGATANYPGGFLVSGFSASTVNVIANQVHWTSL